MNTVVEVDVNFEGDYIDYYTRESYLQRELYNELSHIMYHGYIEDQVLGVL